MKAKRRYLPNFEARSVMLLAAWTFGSAAAVHAQTPSVPASPGAPMTTPSGAINARTIGTTQDVTAAFTRADVNHDGKLSRKEAQAIPVLAEHFNKVDTDHDGFVSFAEYEKAMNSRS